MLCIRSRTRRAPCGDSCAMTSMISSICRTARLVKRSFTKPAWPREPLSRHPSQVRPGRSRRRLRPDRRVPRQSSGSPADLLRQAEAEFAQGRPVPRPEGCAPSSGRVQAALSYSQYMPPASAKTPKKQTLNQRFATTLGRFFSAKLESLSRRGLHRRRQHQWWARLWLRRWTGRGPNFDRRRQRGKLLTDHRRIGH
jgi:hypothetical protein